MVVAVWPELQSVRSTQQVENQQMGQNSLPDVSVAVPVAAAAAAVVKCADDWLATGCLLGFPLRACQIAVWGQTGGRHCVLATAVDRQLGLASHW